MEEEIVPLKNVLTSMPGSRFGSGPWVPENAYCEVCGKLLRDTPGLAEVFRAHEVEFDTPSLFCHCVEEEGARMEFANLPTVGEPRTFDSFDQRDGTEEAYRAAVAIADRRGPAILTIVGDTGRGKSHLLEAIGRNALAMHARVKYEYIPELVGHLHAALNSQADGDVETLMQRYRGVPVLLLDDLGAEKTSEWGLAQVAAIIDFRLRMAAWTAVTTNLTHDKMLPISFRLASRLWDIRTGNARVVTLTCKTDYRLERPGVGD